MDRHSPRPRDTKKVRISESHLALTPRLLHMQYWLQDCQKELLRDSASWPSHHCSKSEQSRSSSLRQTHHPQYRVYPRTYPGSERQGKCNSAFAEMREWSLSFCLILHRVCHYWKS